MPLTLKYSTTGINNVCFLSQLQYYDCSVVSGALQLTLNQAFAAQGTLELWLDSGVDNPIFHYHYHSRLLYHFHVG